MGAGRGIAQLPAPSSQLFSSQVPADRVQHAPHQPIGHLPHDLALTIGKAIELGQRPGRFLLRQLHAQSVELRQPRGDQPASQAESESGKLIVFTGPIKSNTGETKLPAGQQWKTPADVYKNMTFFVDGVIGKVAN